MDINIFFTVLMILNTDKDLMQGRGGSRVRVQKVRTLLRAALSPCFEDSKYEIMIYVFDSEGCTHPWADFVPWTKFLDPPLWGVYRFVNWKVLTLMPVIVYKYLLGK